MNTDTNVKLIPTAILILLLLIVVTVRSSLLGGPTINLNSAPALSGVVAQSLYTANTSALPVINKDFALKDVHYLDNGSWAILTATSVNNSFDPGIFILKKQQQNYVVVLGPGTSFSSDILISLPADVGSYLRNQGVIYEPTGN